MLAMSHQLPQWQDNYLENDDLPQLDSRLDAFHFATTTGDLYSASYPTTAPGTNASFDFSTTAYTTNHGQSSSNGGSYSLHQPYETVNSSTSANNSHQTHESSNVDAIVQALAQMQDTLSQLHQGTPDHTQVLCIVYKLRIQLYAVLCKHITDANPGLIDKASEQNRRQWDNALAQCTEGSQQYLSFAAQYDQFYITLYSQLQSASGNGNEGGPGRGKSFPCIFPGCKAAPSRKADLERHIQTVHDKIYPFWCPVEQCNRSVMKENGKGFSRKDHMIEHLRSVHGKTQDYPKKQNLKREKNNGEGSSRRG